MMDRRRFLLTSLLGAAPAQLVVPPAVEPREPRHESSPFPESLTHAAELKVLANRLQVYSEIVEGYSRLLLREMNETDALRRVPATLLATAERLHEMKAHLRAMAERVPPGRALLVDQLSE